MTFLKWAGFAVLLLILLVGVVALVGFALPRDHVASRSLTIHRPIAEVWATITRVEEFPEWRHSVKSVQVLQRDPLRWREDGSDPLTFDAIETRPPTRFVAEIADRNLPFGGRWVYELKAVGPAAGAPADRTEVTITEHGEVYNPIFRFVSRFVMGHTATIDKYLSDLQKRLS
jgi:hypothetical protein